MTVRPIHLGFRTTPTIEAILRAIAQEQKRTVSHVVHLLLEEKFERDDGKTPGREVVRQPGTAGP